MRRKRSLLFLFSLFGLAWLLWPAPRPNVQITDDAQKLAGKQRYLEAPVAASGSKSPNIVLIVADDLGKHDLTMYGTAPVATPHIDSIARDGALFTDGYITSPICAPSRAGLMTGRYQQRFGFELITHDRYPRNRLEHFVARTFFAGRGWQPIDELVAPSPDEVLRQGLPPSEITIAEALKKAGYATAIFGKWHLGFNERAIPTARGFDYHYGFYEAFSLYQDPDSADVVNAHDSLFADRYQWWKGRHGNCAIRRNGIEIDEKVYLTESIARETTAWIDAHHGAPFFAYVPFSAPHAPLQAPRRYVDKFAHINDPLKRVYYAMIASLDDAVGDILASLDRNGVADNTLVIFLSDNGGAAYSGVTDNAPLSGGKFTSFEGGVNVPFALRFPGRIAAGKVYRDPVSSLDLFPTVATAAGVALPGDRPFDGVDLLPHLASGSLAHDVLFWRAEGHRAVRSGAYKLVSDQRTGSRALFDLVQDKGETHDLSSDTEKVDALEARLREWEGGLMQPMWPHVMDYHFEIGGKAYVFPL